MSTESGNTPPPPPAPEPQPPTDRSDGRAPWRDTLRTVIFGVDTPAGKRFDVILLWCIILSVTAVMLESVEPLRAQYGTLFDIVEWTFTVIFTIEYILRLLCARRPVRYARSFYGIVDLLSVVPTYLELFIPGTQALIVLRALRLLRVFRVLKLVHFMQDADLLVSALHGSRRKITTFLGAVLVIALIIGTLMYLVEGNVEGTHYTSIPKGMYWAIVTITTVGFGDIAPQTTGGQVLASVLMIMGYSIIAVPTGIVSVELAHATEQQRQKRACPQCALESHDVDATYCKRCGRRLDGGGSSDDARAPDDP